MVPPSAYDSHACEMSSATGYMALTTTQGTEAQRLTIRRARQKKSVQPTDSFAGLLIP